MKLNSKLWAAVDAKEQNIICGYESPIICPTKRDAHHELSHMKMSKNIGRVFDGCKIVPVEIKIVKETK